MNANMLISNERLSMIQDILLATGWNKDAKDTYHRNASVSSWNGT